MFYRGCVLFLLIRVGRTEEFVSCCVRDFRAKVHITVKSTNFTLKILLNFKTTGTSYRVTKPTDRREAASPDMEKGPSTLLTVR